MWICFECFFFNEMNKQINFSTLKTDLFVGVIKTLQQLVFFCLYLLGQTDKRNLSETATFISGMFGKSPTFLGLSLTYILFSLGAPWPEFVLRSTWAELPDLTGTERSDQGAVRAFPRRAHPPLIPVHRVHAQIILIWQHRYSLSTSASSLNPQHSLGYIPAARREIRPLRSCVILLSLFCPAARLRWGWRVYWLKPDQIRW